MLGYNDSLFDKSSPIDETAELVAVPKKHFSQRFTYNRQASQAKNDEGKVYTIYNDTLTARVTGLPPIDDLAKVRLEFILKPS